jgi:glycosyltransferase 2 family protein
MPGSRDVVQPPVLPASSDAEAQGDGASSGDERAARPARRNRRLAALVGLAVSVVFCLLAVRRLDVHGIAAAWRGAHPMPWILAAIACYLAGHFVRGQRCRLLVQRESTLPFLTACNIVVVGYASNNVLPARLGELVRAGMLVERTGIPTAQALTITFVERLLDGVSILLLLLLASTGATHVEGWIRHLIQVAAVAFAVATLVILVAVSLPRALIAGTSRVTARFGPKVHDRAVVWATSIASGASVLRRPKLAARIAVLSVVVWVLESGMFLCLFPAFSLAATPEHAVVAMAVTNLGILVPSSPGFIGPFHFFCSQALVSFGVSPTTALAYAVLVHLAFYVPVTAWGAAAILRYGTQVGTTAAMAWTARASAGTRALGRVTVTVIATLDSPAQASRTPRFYVALTEALVPSIAGPDAEGRIARVADFVHGQMEALPPRLRVMLHAGLLAFRAAVRLRHFTGFCALSSGVRRDCVNRWAFGRVTLFRQLFRPLRSTALLAHYDLPLRADAEGSRPVRLNMVRP